MNNADLFPEIINLLHQDHTVTLGLRGYSMRPFLEDGRDSALLTKVDGTWKVSDPILAEIQPGHYVLHRIINIQDESVTLLGDGNVTPEHCHVSDFRAQIIGFYRNGSHHLDRLDGWKWRLHTLIWHKILHSHMKTRTKLLRIRSIFHRPLNELLAAVRRRLLLALLILVAPLLGDYGHVASQSLTYDYEKKVLLASSISMPPSTRLLHALQAFPELLHRPGTSYIDTYDLRVEGLTVGDSKDAILSEIQLQDIEKIEITDLPLSNYEKNGQGGIINVVLKALPEGTSGNAAMVGSYPYDFIPGFSLNHKNSKWTVRSFFTGEVYSNETETPLHYKSLLNTPLLGFTPDKNQTINDDQLYQMARVYANYSPNSSNLFKFSFSENFNRTNKSSSITVNQNDDSESYTQPTVTQNTKRYYDLVAKAYYKHSFPINSAFVTEMVYNFDPVSTSLAGITDYSNYSNITDHKHTLSGKFEYDQTLTLKTQNSKLTTQNPQPTTQIRLTAGVSYNYFHTNTDASYVAKYTPLDRNTTSNNLFLNPYFKVKATLGPVSLFLDLEYQNYFYHLRGNAISGLNVKKHKTYTSTQSNLVGNLFAIWRITPEHTLRLSADRRLKRPSDSQLFPYLLYSVSGEQFQLGNPDLKPMIMDCLTLEYILNKDAGISHWQFSLGGKYTNTHDNILTQNSDIHVDGTTYNYTYYVNSQKDRILTLFSMLQWRYRWFSIMATGNYFNRYTPATKIRHQYYNVALTPEVQLPHNWTICTTFHHNAKITINDVTTAPTLDILDFVVSKSWNRFSVFAHASVSFNKKYSSTTLTDDGNTQLTTTVYPYTNYYLAGLRYNF